MPPNDLVMRLCQYPGDFVHRGLLASRSPVILINRQLNPQATGVITTMSVCPWWMSFVLDNLFRQLIQNPDKMLGEYIGEGETVVDLGCGPGFFTIAMARLVGDRGSVIAVDLQEQMLRSVVRRARAAGLEARVKPHVCREGTIGLNTRVDFALAFYMVHEVPDVAAFLEEVVSILKPEGRLLLVEPKFHVSKVSFDKTVQTAINVGLRTVSEPVIFGSRAVLFANGGTCTDGKDGYS
jgi:ubiquinone/menaquinone biosynthesis C-methylase UbiE